MTDDMVKNVNSADQKPQKNTIQFPLGDRLSRPKTSKNKNIYIQFALCRYIKLHLPVLKMDSPGACQVHLECIHPSLLPLCQLRRCCQETPF